MAVCDKNILDIPVSPSIPAPTDVVMFTLQDGTTVLRTWASVLQLLSLPADIEFQIGITSGAPAVGTFTYTNSALIGKKVRLYREGRKMPTLGDSTTSKYSFNSATGTVTVNDPWGDQEIINIEPY